MSTNATYSNLKRLYKNASTIVELFGLYGMTAAALLIVAESVVAVLPEEHRTNAVIAVNGITKTGGALKCYAGTQRELTIPVDSMKPDSPYARLFSQLAEKGLCMASSPPPAP